MAAFEKITYLYDGNPHSAEKGSVMHVKSIEISAERIRNALRYSPETGKFTWLISPNRRMKAGDEAGALKYPKGRDGMPYRYLTLDGVSTPAARVAWFFLHSEWPMTTMRFADGDTNNLREDNLRLATFPTNHTIKDGRRVYKMSREAARHYGLRRYYGLTGKEYGAMLAAQKGLCLICERPETAMFNGQPKVMHVDHDHETGAIRGLLCGKCNGGLGLFDDNPIALRAAADYIEKHAVANAGKVVNLTARIAKDGAA